MSQVDERELAVLNDFHVRGRQLLEAQTNSLNAVIDVLHNLDLEKARSSVWVPALMLQAVGVSIHSVLALTHKRSMAIRDGFGIARSAVETSINAAYIACEGDQLGDRAIRHMRQKRWRDLHREIQIGDLHITASRDISAQVSDFPGLEDALEEFTRAKRGTEIREWIDLKLEDRIAAVGGVSQKGGLALGSAFFGIYRPASELLHGSYYGVNYFWQGSRDLPARDHAAFDKLWVTEHFVLLLSTLFLSVTGAVDALAQIHSLPEQSDRQNSLSQELLGLIEGLHALDPDDEHRFTANVSERN